MKSVKQGVCLLVFAVWVMLPGRSPAQDARYRVSGAVYDRLTDEPLPGATIYVDVLGKGASADTSGNYQLTGLPSGRYRIRFSYVGYHAADTLLLIDRDLRLDMALTPSLFELGELRVTAGRDSLMESTRSLQVIDKAELDRSRGQSIGEALREVPGVTLLRTGPSIAKPVVRGLHSQRIVTMNNGVVQEGQQWGGEHAPEIDPFAPDRIEVVRGAAGVQYGPGAIGGVIRVGQQPIDKGGVGGEVNLNAFSNNLQGAAALEVSGGAPGLKGLGWRLQGSLRRAGDTRTPRDVVGNSGFKEASGSATLNYEHGAFTHDLYYSHFGTELGIYRGAHIGNFTDLVRAIKRGRPLVDYDFSYGIDPPKQQITHDLLRYRAGMDLPRWGQLQLQYSFQDNHRQEFDAHKRFSDDPDALNRPAFDLRLRTHTADLKYRHRPAGRFTGTVGLNGMAQTNVREGAGFLIPNFRAYGGGLYAMEQWTGETLTLEAGARYDYHWRRVFAVESKGIEQGDYIFNSFTVVTGATWQFHEHWSLSGNAGTAWRPPGVNEQFSNGVHHGTAQYEQGDAGLGPEKSYSADLTLRRLSPRWYGQLSAYYNRIDDYIYLYPEPEPVVTIRGTFPYFTYRATDAALYGVDGTLEYQLTDPLRAAMTLSVVRGDNRATGEPLIHMPADRLRLSGHYHLPGTGRWRDSFLEVGATLVRGQHRYPEQLDYAPPPDGYALFDIEAGTTIPAGGSTLKLSAAVGNVLNATYRDYLSRFRYFIDEPGRNLIIKAQLQF